MSRPALPPCAEANGESLPISADTPTLDLAPSRVGVASASQTKLGDARAAEHPQCLLCGAGNPLGFGLRFQVFSDDSVRATFRAGNALQSYPDRLHGGVAAALLDAAMTNALFAIGVVAVTASLEVRYLAPIKLEDSLEVIARIEEHAALPLYYVCSELQQCGAIVAKGKAKFFVKPTKT